MAVVEEALWKDLVKEAALYGLVLGQRAVWSLDSILLGINYHKFTRRQQAKGDVAYGTYHHFAGGIDASNHPRLLILHK